MDVPDSKTGKEGGRERQEDALLLLHNATAAAGSVDQQSNVLANNDDERRSARGQRVRRMRSWISLVSFSLSLSSCLSAPRLLYLRHLVSLARSSLASPLPPWVSACMCVSSGPSSRRQEGGCAMEQPSQ